MSVPIVFPLCVDNPSPQLMCGEGLIILPQTYQGAWPK